jgi:RNA polymerase sigma-70 factor (ECF subfamily)
MADTINILDKDLDATRVSLVRKLQESLSGPAWKEFFDRYWMLLFRTARRAGLNAMDAEDVVQEALIGICERIKTLKYEPGQGSFRGWLLRITRRRIADHWRSRASEKKTVFDESKLDGERSEPPTPGELEKIWDEEWQLAIQTLALEHAKQQVTAKQFQIFEMHVVKGQPVKAVCDLLGVNAGQVYLAKLRVGRIVEREVQLLRERL